MSSAGDEARKRMQVKSFTTWVNLHLGRVGLEVQDLKTDFADGIKLINLIEVISEESLGRYNKKPRSKFEKVENLNIPLKYINDFIKSTGIKNMYSAENILDENELLILGMIYSLIMKFAVQHVSEGDRTAKEGLLLWAQKKVEEGSKGKYTVNNFHTSWQDGTAFCSLIQAFRPDLIDATQVRKSDDPDTMVKTLNIAFDVAESSLGIPKMLDASDMAMHKPDEKSVMTYISFFHKEFASNKKKTLAADRVAKVVQRELQYKELQAQYVERASALATWLQETKKTFAEKPTSSDTEQLHQTLDSYADFGRNERPAKLQELLDVEALYESISSRLQSLGGRSYTPPEGTDIALLKRWWEELTAAEQTYEGGIKDALTNLKRVGGLIKMYHTRAGKLEAWCGQKAAWVQASHDTVLVQLGKPPSPAAKLDFPPAAPTAALAAAAEADEKLEDPTTAPPPVPMGTPSQRNSRAMSMPPKPSAPEVTPEPKAKEEGDAAQAEDSDRPPSKRRSIFDNIFDALAENFGDKGKRKSEGDGDGDGDGDGGDPPSTSAKKSAADVSRRDLSEYVNADSVKAAESEVAGADAASAPAPALAATPSAATASILRGASRSTHNLFAHAMSQHTSRMKEAQLDSISAVMARLNLLKAYEEEQASRNESLRALGKLYDDLAAMGCPRLDLLAKRREQIQSSFSALVEAVVAYRSDLEEVLRQQQQLDDQRLDFAKRAEALNRWLEEVTDAMSEVLQVDTMREADVIEAELGAFSQETESRRAECDSLSALETALDASGPNPYSRFHAADLSKALNGAVAAADERAKRLAAERVKISGTDQQKRDFAAAAEAALKFLQAEKQQLEATTPPLTVHPDDADSIAAGRAREAQLEEYAAKASERAEQLAPAQELADMLFAKAEMDNPYTRQSMASLKSAFDQLEKLVRDKLSFVSGQLARATVDISDEQAAELRKAFDHFDRDHSGRLNKLEFQATMKSMDFEEDIDSVFDKFADGQGTNPDTGAPEGTISFDAFLNLMLQQFKDSDTIESLNGAFRTLANGKDALPKEEIEKHLKPAECAYLCETLAEAEGGYDYLPFSNAVYNA